MNQNQADFRLMHLWVLAAEGHAAAEELEELNHAIATDPRAQQIIFELSQQQGSLKWGGARAPGLALPALGVTDSQLEAIAGSDLFGIHELLEIDDFLENSSLTAPAVVPLEVGGKERSSRMSEVRIPLLSWQMVAIAASVALMTCTAFWMAQPGAGEVQVVNASPPEGFHAEVISATPCLWSNSDTPLLSLGQEYHEGDAVTLLEGVAELRIASRLGDTTVQLEGPVACVLGTNGIANLRYGKISIDNRKSSVRNFVVETSFGRVVVNPGAEIGISTFGSIAEVHVFHGSAALDSPWLVSDVGELTSRAIDSRKAIRVAQDNNSIYEFTVIDADRSQFTPQVSSRGNLLAIPKSYVERIKKDEPVAYWRFDGCEGGRVLNEMCDQFHGQLSGDYRWVGPEDSRAIEFGVLPHPGMLRVKDSWTEVLSGSFSFEFWMKPSHYHHGTIISLAGPFNWNLKKNPLGIAVETMGGWGDGASTNRLRFLVREPVGYVEDSSTYTDHLYSPGYWQHVVVTRDDNTFNTYMDGTLVQSQTGISKVPVDLTLIIGKLYTDELYRPFIGCLDEIAVYDRALSDREVESHAREVDLGRSLGGS